MYLIYLVSCFRIQEVFIEAEKNRFLFRGSPVVTVHEDNDKFKHLDDSILELIDRSGNANMKVAQSLIKILDRKEFWRKIWESEEDFSKNAIHEIVRLSEIFGNHFVAAKKEVGLEVPENVPLYDASGAVSSKIS